MAGSHSTPSRRARSVRNVLLALLGLSGCGVFVADGAAGGTAHRASPAASTSGPIALAPDGALLWVVNPDADSVTPIDVATLEAAPPIAVGREPWSVAVAPSGLVVVMNRAGGSLSLLREGAVIRQIDVGPEPGGLALSPSGATAYVTLSSADEVAVVDLDGHRVVERLAVGRLPWSIAVTNDGDADDQDETIVVAHRQARRSSASVTGAEAWLTLMGPEGRRSEAAVAPFEFGFPNHLEGIALAGDDVFVTHLLNSPEEPHAISSMVSAAVSVVSLSAARVCADCRIDLADARFSTPVNFPRSIALTGDGRTAYVALAGSDAVMGIDLTEPAAPRLIGFWPVGANPRGVVLAPDGSRAYVMNYLSRDVSVLDLSDTVRRREVARVAVAPETLAPAMIEGKVLFNSAVDPRMSRIGWMSCASCHPDGGADGTTWIVPDGARQTPPLWALDGTAPFHRGGTRDEIQDVETDIEGLMGGVGLAAGPARRLLGEPNAGASPALDALAAFVLAGIRVPAADPSNPEAIAVGRAVFADAGCAACHGGSTWTGSRLPGEPGTLAPNGETVVVASLHDVGTYDPGAGGVGELGFDPPSLLGLHATAPYFHDGSATTLVDVLAHPIHTSIDLGAEERSALVAFLRSIDAGTAPFDEAP